MNVLHQETNNKGSFYIEINGEKLAEMTYSKAGESKIIIDHTEVDGALRGKGAGYQLVLAAVKLAREKKISILPLCPFAKAVFIKNRDLHDVLS